MDGIKEGDAKLSHKSTSSLGQFFQMKDGEPQFGMADILYNNGLCNIWSAICA